VDIGILNSVVTLFVGGIALTTYWLGKKHEKSSAATIVIMDIRHAESVVQSILEKDQIDINTKDVLFENNWSKYKHLFAKDFSQDDFAAFNRFFDSCVEMSDARNKLREVHYTTINTKARLMQERIYGLDNLASVEGQAKANQIFMEISQGNYGFDPDEPKNRIMKNLQMMGRLSNTSSFNKLKKYGGEKT
jgi:hypothetical protein